MVSRIEGIFQATHVEHAMGSKKTVACACKMQECVFPSLQEVSYCLFSA